MTADNQTTTGWQPIETAPKKPLDDCRYGPRILSFNTHGHCFSFWDEDFDRFFVVDEHENHQQPTHWMPLPKPPK